MTNVQYALSKLKLTRAALDAVRRDDFPYEDSRTVLDAIDNVLISIEQRIQSLSVTSNRLLISSVCEEVTKKIAVNMDFLGFVRRSTNVRNAFEFYGPILLLSRKLLNKDIKLVITSEWKFSPFTYPRIYDHLRNFVFIGLPASESSNSLILPLCGHELGHHAWHDLLISDKLRDEVSRHSLQSIKAEWITFAKLFPGITQDNLQTDMFAMDLWSHVTETALRQCEEVYCDFIGLRIFGESYLYAFQYILAPSLGSPRHPYYPTNVDRAKYLEEAATYFKLAIPENFSDNFRNDPERGSIRDRFLLSLSDAVVAIMCSRLVEEVDELAKLRSIERTDPAKANRIYEDICKGVPPTMEVTVGDLLNGAWIAYHDSALWENRKSLRDRKFEVLNEITLKALEVVEAIERMGRP